MTIVSTGSLTLKDLNDAKQLSMSIGGSQSKTIIYDGVSAYTPNYSTAGQNQVLTPTLRIAGGGIITPSATRWYYKTNGSGAETAITVNGSGYTLGGTQPITLTIASNVVASNTSMTYIAECDYTDPDTQFPITVRSEIEIVKVTNGTVGENAVTAFLTNSSATVPASSAGVVSSYTGTNTEIYVYDGATALVYDGVGTSNGKFKVVATASNITSGAITASASGTARAIVAVTSGMSSSQDVATVTFAITGKQLDGTAISTSLVLTVTKSKAGVDSTTYNVKPSASVISKSALGVTSPATLTFTGYTTTGSGTPTSVASGYKFIIGTQTSVGGAYTDGSATGALASTTFTTSFTNLVSVRVRMYRASDTPNGATNMVDEQTVYVVQDGTNSIYANVWAPDGNAIQNSLGSLTAKIDLYDGVTPVSSGATYKWYIQNPLATTSSLGDADGGNGWELITSVADPTALATISAPTTAGATLPVGTYYIKYTWLGKVGESKGSSTQQTQATTAVGQGVSVTVPTFPSGVTGAKVYIGNASGDANLYYQGQINASAGNLTIKTLTTSGDKVPTTTGGAVSTNATLYIEAFGILGMEGFKSVATYGGNKYSGVVTVQDLSDPIQVDIQGVDTFKNGTGTTVLKAVLYQQGVEIDASGTQYTYTWKMYDATNVLVSTTYSTMSGKSVTIDGRDVNARANIICEVSK